MNIFWSCLYTWLMSDRTKHEFVVKGVNGNDSDSMGDSHKFLLFASSSFIWCSITLRFAKIFFKISCFNLKYLKSLWALLTPAHYWTQYLCDLTNSLCYLSGRSQEASHAVGGLWWEPSGEFTLLCSIFIYYLLFC